MGGKVMIVKWLDFSDLHFEYRNVNTDNIRENLISTIKEEALNADFLLLCGDFFYQGKSDENIIKKCGDYIHELASASGCDKASIYMTLGNHDLERSDRRLNSLMYYTGMNYSKGKRIEDGHELDDMAYKELSSPQNATFSGYAKLVEEVTGQIFKGENQCIEKDGYRILNINTCVVAGSKYDEGNLKVYGTPLLNECKKIKNDDCINVAFMHHGVEYFRKSEQKKFQQLMESYNIDVVFSGHSHEIGIKTYDHTEKRIQQFTCGGPLNDGYNKPSFYYCIYNSESHQLNIILYAYNDELEIWDFDQSERAFQHGGCSFILPRSKKRKKKKEEVQEKGKIEFTENYLKQFGIETALPLKDFVKLRNQLIQNAEGDIILAGQSLENAFDIREDNESIVNSIKQNKKINNIDIFLTDPIMFDSSAEIEIGDTPISRIESTMHTILYHIYKDLDENQSINIYFIPLVQLDHMVFANDVLLLRHTLLWTNDSHFKATPLVCTKVDRNNALDRNIINSSMYNVYKEYINRLKNDSMVIEIKKNGNTATQESKAKKCHRSWRNRLYQLKDSGKLKGNIEMHKLYRTQLISDLHSTWDPRFRSFSSQINWGDEGESGFFFADQDRKIDTYEKLYCPENLLNDSTQKILLPYVKETEHLLDGLVKKYDKYGEVHIFPSLDIGMPNNVLRLAGGFATGMLIVWKSGTPIVPVDTTVNVCSSSYYEFDSASLKGKNIKEFFNSEIIDNIITKGSKQEGLAFSFNTGNHFVLLSKSKTTGHFYLVLHSSAKQYKDSYLGLYPKPHNWYSDYVKTYKEKNNPRYIHYLKDREAERFINIARTLNEQNRDIHNWFAKQIFGDIRPIQRKTYHHYGMPTDYSIAIGTYVIDEDDVVPIFSREGAPIVLFRPSSDMWSIELEGKRKFVVPHGWGQKLNKEYFGEFAKDDFKNIRLGVKNKKLFLEDSYTKKIIRQIDVNYSARFEKGMLDIRNLCDKEDFEKGNIFGTTPYLKGTIEEILDPIALYSRETSGGVKYYI